MTAFELLDKIHNLDRLLDNFGSSNPDSRELWGLRKEISAAFKEVRFDERQERQDAWEKFILLCNSLRQKQDEVNRENEKFAEDANRRINDIENSLSEGLFSKSLDKDDFASIKQKLFDTFEIIKQHRWPSKDIKTAAWDKYNLLRDKLREKENKFYSEIREKKTKRIDHSGELTNKILNTIDACDPNTSLDALFDLLGKLALYATGIGFIFDFIDLLTGSKDNKPANPLKVKSQSLKDIRKFINDNKDDITREDKQKIFSRLDIVQSDLNRAWDDYKEQRETKKHEWERKQRDFVGKLESRLSNQISFKSKLENVLNKQQAFVTKLESRLENQQDFLRKIKGQLDDLEDKYNDAHSDSFRDRVSGWIDEKKSKISEVEDDIDQLKDKIRDVENDIEELPDKIRNIENDIEELEKKVDDARGKLDR